MTGRRIGLLQDILSFARRLIQFSKGSIWLTVGVAILAGVAEAFGILLIIPFLDLQGLSGSTGGWQASVLNWLTDVGIVGQHWQILTLLGVLLTLALVRSVLVWIRTQRMTKLSIGFANAERESLYSSVAQADWLRLLNHSKIGLEHALVEDSMRVEIAAQATVYGLVTGLTVLIQLAIAFWVSPLLTGLVVLIFLFAILIIRPFLRRARRLGQDTTDINRSMFDVLGQFMDGLKSARVSGTQAGFLTRFKDGLLAQEQLALRSAALQAGFSITFQMLTLLAITAVFAFALLVLKTPLPILVALLLLLMRLSGPIQNLLSQAQALASELPAMELMDERVVDLSRDGTKLPTPQDHVGGAPKINFHKVGFSYLPEKPIINQFSATFEPGQIIAVHGPSGVGKTTLLDLLSGLLDPVSGKVTVARLDPAEAFWSGRYRLAYLLQSPVLFETTVRESLSRDLPETSDIAIWNALDKARLKARVESLPLQLDAPISITNLSGGEAQRLGFARLFLHPADVVLLDEATNAMDPALEAEVLAELRALPNKPTIILVNHRDADPDWADQVIDLGAEH